MDEKPKFDLSNVGGKPKDWLERGADYDAEFSWWDDLKMVAGFLGLPLLFLAAIGFLAYALLKFGGKL